MPVLPRFTVDGFRGVGRVGGVGPVAVENDDGVLRPASGATGGPHRSGTLLAGVVDHHVHLGLIVGACFAASPVVEVHDLGWIPEVARGWRRAPHTGGVIRIAGPILTAPGGYPLGHSWAPDAMVRQLGAPEDARAAVADGVAHDHDLVKVALHAGQGRFDDAVLEAVVSAAHEAGLPVGAHAEGPGQAERALEAGIDVLVHVPWTEVLPDRLVAAMARRTTWISTLGIHRGRGLAMASGNARAFLAHGGRLVYGTDLGNGPAPAGLSMREVEALADLGAGVEALLDMLTGPPLLAIPVDRAVLAPGPPPTRPSGVARWIAGARRLPQIFGECC